VGGNSGWPVEEFGVRPEALDDADRVPVGWRQACLSAAGGGRRTVRVR